MGAAHPRLAPPSWLRLPRRTARLRLTALYGGLFLLSGVALVAVTYGLFERATEYRTPHLPTIPHTPAIQRLKLSNFRLRPPNLRALWANPSSSSVRIRWHRRSRNWDMPSRSWQRLGRSSYSVCRLSWHRYSIR